MVLLIRHEQIHALRRRSPEPLLATLIRHARACFLEECEALGDEGLRLRVQASMETAWSVGFTSDRHQCQFLGLAMLWGPEFFRAPEHRWARAIVHDPLLHQPASKMARLMEGAKAKLDARADPLRFY